MNQSFAEWVPLATPCHTLKVGMKGTRNGLGRGIRLQSYACAPLRRNPCTCQPGTFWVPALRCAGRPSFRSRPSSTARPPPHKRQPAEQRQRQCGVQGEKGRCGQQNAAGRRNSFRSPSCKKQKEQSRDPKQPAFQAFQLRRDKAISLGSVRAGQDRLTDGVP
jgi:hypothetical protein